MDIVLNDYHIWSEGYACTGQSSGAYYHGMAAGQTFKEACDGLFIGDSCYNRDTMTHWGCKLYDNESDARRTFG